MNACLCDWGTQPTPQALQAALQQGLPGFAEGHLQIETLQVLNMRRSSSKRRHPHPLTVCVDLQVHVPASARRGVQRLYGKAYREGASAGAYPQALSCAVAPADFGVALAHLPAHDMLWWAWPNDPGLPQLPTLLDPLRLQAHLPARCGGDAGVTEVQALRYEPERRATLRCRLRDGRVIYGKTFCDGHAATVLARFEHAWGLAAQDPLAAAVALPLGMDEATSCFWQAAAPGVPLMELADEDAVPALRRLGQALARLHATPSAHGEPQTVAHWLAEARLRAKKITRVAPDLGPRAAALVQQLQAVAETLPEPPLTLVHGDFHPDQVWVHEGRPVLFDFDEFALGHPMQDLAAFITKLQQAEAASDTLRTAGTRALLQGYRAAAPEHWQPRWLHWHHTVQALMQASRAFVFQVPGWPAQLALRLAVAEHCALALQEVAA